MTTDADIPGGGLRLEQPRLVLHWGMRRGDACALLHEFLEPPETEQGQFLTRAVRAALGSKDPPSDESRGIRVLGVSALGGLRLTLDLHFNSSDRLQHIGTTSVALDGRGVDHAELQQHLSTRFGSSGAPSDIGNNALHWTQAGAEVWLIEAHSESFDLSFPILLFTPPACGSS